MSTAVLDFVNLILQYRHALLHDSNERGHRFSDDPAVFCLLAKNQVHHASKPALRAVKELGEQGTFAPLIEEAYFQFFNFCKEAEIIPATTNGRVQRLLASVPWRELRTALDRIVFHLPVLQDASGEAESILDRIENGEAFICKVIIPPAPSAECDEGDREEADTADTKADTSKKKKLRLPQSPELLKFIRELKKCESFGVRKLDIAREIVGQDEDRARNLCRQARQYKHLWQPKDAEQKADT